MRADGTRDDDARSTGMTTAGSGPPTSRRRSSSKAVRRSMSPRGPRARPAAASSTRHRSPRAVRATMSCAASIPGRRTASSRCCRTSRSSPTRIATKRSSCRCRELLVRRGRGCRPRAVRRARAGRERRPGDSCRRRRDSRRGSAARVQHGATTSVADSSRGAARHGAPRARARNPRPHGLTLRFVEGLYIVVRAAETSTAAVTDDERRDDHGARRRNRRADRVSDDRGYVQRPRCRNAARRPAARCRHGAAPLRRDDLRRRLRSRSASRWP